MKKIFTTTIIVLLTYAAHACYADYTYTNGCVGDTLFFIAFDGYAAYSWDYGDSASGSANVSHDVNGYHVYTTPGDYYVTLFVNIGAEWDYRTNVIHITNSCFKADFTSTCNQPYYSFTDFSTGIHTSQFWDFGDPLSGTTDTSSDINPIHYFTSAGSYTITYIISDSSRADTLIRTINIDSVCLSAYIANFTSPLNCVGYAVLITPSYSTGVTYYHWDYGDPASGTSNVSNAGSGTHMYATAGIYTITLIYGDGTQFDTLTKAIVITDCTAWPGDANADGEVNGEDIFPLGIYKGNTGTQRNAATTNWTSQPATNWGTNGYKWMYLENLTDMKMADCNGDGVIDSLDLQAIYANYGKHHNNHNNQSAILYHNIGDPTLQVTPLSGAVAAGSNITIDVSLGSASSPANYVYGYVYTLLYDPAMVDSGAVVILNTNWLDSTGNSNITFFHENHSAGRLEIAFVKTNLISQSGYGNIATITFHTKSTADGAFDIGIDGSAKIFNTNQYGGSGGNQEVFSPMFLQGASVNVQNPTGITAIANTKLSIFPNPSNGSLFVHHERLNEPLQLELLNALGERILIQTLSLNTETETLQLPNVSNGLYEVVITNTSGSMIDRTKLVVLK